MIGDAEPLCSDWSIFVINLDRMPDGWKVISQHLKSENVVRVPAVDGM